jgi:3-oxoadipate enol-lactonase
VPDIVAPDGTRIHHERFGRADGEPVLLLQGLGADRRGWIRQRRAVGERYRAIAVDNRGVGRSEAPPGPYDLRVMADDAVAVLDELGIESAHVVGVSMGGILSQIIAVEHPGRVRSLTLACTACRHHAWRRELLAEWGELAVTEGMKAVVDAASPWLIGPRARLRFWPVISVLAPMALQVSPAAFKAQIDAILALDDSLRFDLAGVEVPALVIVGSQDVLTPMGDSELLHELLPHSELQVVGGGSHGFTVEQAGAFNRAMRGFLDRVSAGVDVP